MYIYGLSLKGTDLQNQSRQSQRVSPENLFSFVDGQAQPITQESHGSTLSGTTETERAV